jgi:hypothetical protein
MNHHHGKTNEAERWENRELRDPMARNTSPLGQREYHSTMRSPGFAGTLSHHARQVPGVPTLVASDTSTVLEVELRSFWWNNGPSPSSSPDRKLPAKPELSQIPPPPSPPRTTIEISPGVHVPLRGADETWKAIANDFYMPAECICCESTIFCIQDADYVLCPDCRVVSCMKDPSSHRVGGVGLGFKYEDLARWQEDILRWQ